MASRAQLRAPLPDPCTQAGRVRRVFHFLMALSGWALFFYWWHVVLQRVSQREIDYTILFVTLSLIIVVAVTGFWAFHNLHLYRRRGRRREVRAVSEDLSRDVLGRPLRFDDDADHVRHSGVVRVRFEGGAKIYGALTLVPAIRRDRAMGGGGRFTAAHRAPRN